MRKFYVLLILVAVAFNYSIGQTVKAKIDFESLEHDFGTFKEEQGSQSYSFKFTNNGASPLILNNVRAACGCTTPQWTKEPVAPGQSGFIKVSYNPRNRPGPFNKTVTVTSNAENTTVVLRIKGVVEQREKTLAEKYPREIGPLRAKTNHLSFVKIAENDVKTEELEVINDSGESVKVDFKTPPGHLTVKAEPATIPAKGKGKIIVTYDAGKINSYGFMMHRIYLTLNGESNYRNSIGISATIEEDFSALTPEELASAPVVSFDEKAHDFGDINQGDEVEHTFTIKNSGKRDLIIRRVKTSCGCTAVTPEKKIISANESVPLKVKFNSRGKRGRQNKSITVITNDPKNPTTILRVSTNIKSAG
ncbi:DUF1573 domain-containing protein [Sunxiuqinia elliptica]|uniref:Uncharacterized protein DUF1573 n=1 Tax=Sunxiuqinia elliptica TaxID=655355 RepID=A0A4R6H9P2_9BACT|nr:DUF1573 domain-containing protein [Sunxiuqinia elliptica]TDO05062.1 uncharacterized protein DUF1573 [Sunxiuqinia elliptica]TDO64611.1 uncharacterized protein DUF1573 [Sunxiuqinia elliptica]